MIGLWGLLHGLTLALAGLVVGIGVGLILAMWVARKRAGDRLSSLEVEIYESTEKDALSRALRRQAVRKLPDGRYLVREHPDATIEAWLDRSVLHHWSFEAGGWITGLALICTFLLIALVLADDVGPAIQSTSNMTGLSEAVRKMGAKFVVSMLGILLTIVHGAFRNGFSSVLHGQAFEVSARLADHAVVLSDYHAEINERTANKTEQLYGLMHAQHQETVDSMAQVKEAVKSLGSIEVSVRDIGSELAIRLQQVVKNDIVAGIRKDLEEVTDSLRDAISTSFTTTMKEQLEGVNAELRKFEAAVSSQAHGQVEELLNKLGDAVSGGFTTESSNMKGALERFAEVVPLLEKQLRTLIQSAGTDLARQGAETARVSEALVGKLERVLAGIEHQQQSSAALGQQMAAFVSQTEGTLARSVADAQEQMSARSRVNLQELTSAVSAATGDATEVYRSLVKEVQEAASMLKTARTETAETAKHLGQSVVAVREITRHVNESMGALRSVADSLAKNVDAAQGAVKDGALMLQGNRDVVQQQQKFVTDLSDRWPQLTRQYIEASDQAFMSVSAAWTKHAGSIEQSVGRISSGFNESASEFATAVEDLAEHVQALKLAVQNGAAARAKAT